MEEYSKILKKNQILPLPPQTNIVILSGNSHAQNFNTIFSRVLGMRPLFYQQERQVCELNKCIKIHRTTIPPENILNFDVTDPSEDLYKKKDKLQADVSAIDIQIDAIDNKRNILLQEQNINMQRNNEIWSITDKISETNKILYAEQSSIFGKLIGKHTPDEGTKLQQQQKDNQTAIDENNAELTKYREESSRLNKRNMSIMKEDTELFKERNDLTLKRNEIYQQLNQAENEIRIIDQKRYI